MSIKEFEGKLNNRDLLPLAAFLESLDALMDARNAALGLGTSALSVDEQNQSQWEDYLHLPDNLSASWNSCGSVNGM